MINKLTSALAWLGVLITGVLGVFFAGRKSASDEIKNATEKQALQLQRDADAAMRDGLNKEQITRDNFQKHPVQRTDLD